MPTFAPERRSAGANSRDGSCVVYMTKLAIRRHFVTYRAFQFFDVRKAALLLQRPNKLPLNPDLKNSSRAIGDKREGTNVLCEGGQQLLRHPTCSEQPAAQPTIGDGDIRFFSLRHQAGAANMRYASQGSGKRTHC